MKTPLRSSQWRDPSDGTPGPVQSGVRARVRPDDDDTVDELDSAASNERITAPPPPLDYEDELSAQTVMRALPAGLLARLKRNVEDPGEPIAFDDEVTQVGSIPMMIERTKASFDDVETVVGPAPVLTRAVDVVPTSAPAAPFGKPAVVESPLPSEVSRLPQPAPLPDVALMVPEVPPARDVLPYILLGLGLGLTILLIVCYGR